VVGFVVSFDDLVCSLVRPMVFSAAKSAKMPLFGYFRV
jgi:hypothetical protein